jgi:hypothetical protein
MGLQPAASHKLSPYGAQFPRLQAEKCFLARTGRTRKQIKLYFAVVTAKICDAFYFCSFWA